MFISPIFSLHQTNFFANGLCVVFLLDEGKETTSGSEGKTSIAPLMMERSDAAVIKFGLAMGDESSDDESLMSLSHDGLGRAALLVGDHPAKQACQCNRMSTCTFMICVVYSG